VRNYNWKLVLLWAWVAVMTAAGGFLAVKGLALWRINKLAEPIVEKYGIGVKESIEVGNELYKESGSELPELDELKGDFKMVLEYLDAAGEILNTALETGDEKQFQMASAFIDKANADLKAIKKALEENRKLFEKENN